MSHLFKAWTITWSDSGSKTHDLVVPLQAIKPSSRRSNFISESLDHSVVEVIDLGGCYEIVGQVRRDNDPQGLIDMLRAGQRGLTLTLNDGTGNSVACILISPRDNVVDVDFDEDQVQFDELRVEIRLRKTDGTSFPSWVW